MKTRLLSALAILLAFSSAYAVKVPLTVELSKSSGFELSYDEATKVYSLTAASDPKTFHPKFHFQVLTEDFPEGIVNLSFEYKTSHYLSFLYFNMYDKPTATTPKKRIEYRPELHPSDRWQTCTIDVSTLVNAKLNRLGKAGQWQEIYFYEPIVGSVLQIRNIRYDSGEIGFKDVAVDGQNDAVIEAEDFNTGTGYRARQQERQPRRAYVNPTDDMFPIYAWGGPDYSARGPLGLQKEYQDLWECGFNMTLGSAWPGIDDAALFDGREVNGTYVNLFEGTGLKILAKADIRSYDRVKEISKSPRLAGYHIKDEPQVKDMPEMGYWFSTIREWDNSDRIFYGNMFPTNGEPKELGGQDYQDYVDKFMTYANPNFLSFDMYPVRHHKTEDNIFLAPLWFENLEIVSAKARHYRVPMWTFVQSCQSSAAVNMDEQPKPTEEWMSICAFTGLAYGSQCLQYYMYRWDYSPEYNYQNACIDADGNRTDTWYYAQSINRQVQAQKFVFLGSELQMSAHTGAETPRGCRRLTNEMLPEGVTAVTTGTAGMLVTTLRNGTSLYLMVVNPDVNNSQSLNITTSKPMHQVQKDGTITELAAGNHSYTLPIGGYIIYQVENNLPQHTAYYLAEDAHLPAGSAPGETDTDYRFEAIGPNVRAHQAASNGRYLADMGEPEWQNYHQNKFTDNTTSTISFDQAQDNWGSWYNYEFLVNEDTDVDIAISHSVLWNEYGTVAATGVEPGTYFIENNPTLNWPKQYAASMILELDGTALTPADQPLRPAVPATFTDDGAEFNRILADKSQWVSTKEVDGSVSNILYFWPKAGGDNTFEPTVNAKPDYTSVHLTAGFHTLRVKSLCYPWHFDAIRITRPGSTSGIDSIVNDNTDAPVEWYNLQGLPVNPETAAPGLYLRRQGNKTEKIAL